MPRYDDRYDRYETTRLYVGRLSSRTRSRDLERVFSKYGRVRDVDMKRDYAFVEFSDPRDADDARYHLDGRDFDGGRIIVEFAKGTPHGFRDRDRGDRDRGDRDRGDRDRGDRDGRGPPPGSGRCFNCGLDGHWARDCKAGDWKNKCYRCGERGHIERNCKNPPKKLKRDESYSRSPVRSRSPRRGRSRSPSYSRRSYSRSRSPVKRERAERGHSPQPMSRSPSPKGRKQSLSPAQHGSPALSPKRKNLASPRSGSDNVGSPRKNGRSASGSDRESPVHQKSPATNGRGRSPSPSPSPGLRNDRSPVDDDYEDNDRSPRGSQSP